MILQQKPSTLRHLERVKQIERLSERRNNMEGDSTEEREALGGVKRGKLWWWVERGEAERVNERHTDLLGVQRLLLWDLRRLSLLPFSFKGKASQQGVILARGHCSSSQCSPVGPSMCIVLGHVTVSLAGSIPFLCCLGWSYSCLCQLLRYASV